MKSSRSRKYKSWEEEDDEAEDDEEDEEEKTELEWRQR